MKSFNDSVIYVKNGVKCSAIVLRSQSQEDGEYLALLYADPNGQTLVNSGQYAKIAQVAFNVRPNKPGSVNHWEDVPALSDKEISEAVDAVFPPAAPSASDLDTVAEEQKTKEATSSEVTVIDVPIPAGMHKDVNHPGVLIRDEKPEVDVISELQKASEIEPPAEPEIPSSEGEKQENS